MTNEEKELLLKDLCARLPYGLIVRGIFINYNKEKDKILYEECDKELNIQSLTNYESLKPYLRPMSSMTREEGKEYLTLLANTQESTHYIPDEKPMVEFVDWLNKHHIDYHNLIGKGLALEAPEDMYNH